MNKSSNIHGEPFDFSLNDDDLLPWSKKSRGDVLFIEPKPIKKTEKKTKQTKELEFDHSILCRVARKDQVDQEYTHSKKIIQLEYGIETDQHFDLVNDLKKHNSLEWMEPNVKQTVIVTPRDFSQLPPMNPTEKQKQIVLESEPRIPFTPSIGKKSRQNPNQQPEVHPILTRSKNNHSVIITNAMSHDIMEWRKQKMMASIHMKQLKKLFPSTTISKPIRKQTAKTPIPQQLISQQQLYQVPQEYKTCSQSILFRPDSVPHITQLFGKNTNQHPYYSQSNQIVMSMKQIKDEPFPCRRLVYTKRFEKVLQKSNMNLEKATMDSSFPLSLSQSIKALSLNFPGT